MKIDVLVFGDVMLDEYVHCKAPHAPAVGEDAPLVEVCRRLAPGGAANVAVSCARLGAATLLLGEVGGDAEADLLRDELDEIGDDLPPGALLDARLRGLGGATTRKRRFVDESGRTVLRVDRDAPAVRPGGARGAASFAESVLRYRPAAAPRKLVVAAADYGKGACSAEALGPLVKLCRAEGLPLLVDPPRAGDWGKYGSPDTLFKFNVGQAQNLLVRHGAPLPVNVSALGLIDLVRVTLCRHAIEFAYLVLTLGPRGLMLLPRADAGDAYRVDAEGVPDAHPVGAGDVVLAALAWHASRDGYSREALMKGVDVANRLARRAVARPGTCAVGKADLEEP